MKVDIESLKTAGLWFGAASGVGVPAFTFFSSFPPPLFPGVSLLTAALSGAILYVTAVWKPPRGEPQRRLPPIVEKGRRFLVWAILLLTAYILLFQFTTISTPTEPSARLQLGFGMFDWTLTDIGKEWKRSNRSLTVMQMIKNEAAFTQDRVGILWQTWSVFVAGFVLIALYFSAFTTWATGFALLVKQRSMCRNQGK